MLDQDGDTFRVGAHEAKFKAGQPGIRRRQTRNEGVRNVLVRLQVSTMPWPRPLKLKVLVA
eukprot:scaffold277291_cov46-Prasinocladus_malaysianus.AAC.1